MADIKINGATPSGFYYGGTAASAVYYGSTKLWEAAPAGAVIGGKTYPTVVMPNGSEWLAVNLDYAWAGLSVPTSGASNPTSPQAMYYDYNESTYGWNGKKLGLLYNGYAMAYLEANKATLCPGWHVPSKTEMVNMINSLAAPVGQRIKSADATEWWDGGCGTDDYGFALGPAGKFTDMGAFDEYGGFGYLWTSTTTSATAAYTYFWKYNSTSTSSQASNYKYQFSIRLVKDSS